MAGILFPRECGLGSYWIRIIVAKSFVIIVAVALLRFLPGLDRRTMVLIAATVVMPFENYFAVVPRGRALGHGAAARTAAFLPVIREFYISWLMISVRSPSSYLYSSPYDE